MGIEATPSIPRRRNSTRFHNWYDADFQRNTIELASMVLEHIV